LGLFAEILIQAVTFFVKYQVSQTPSSFYLANAMVVFLSTLLQRFNKKLSVGEEGNTAPFIDD
jgi:hypothetical protein